MLRLNDVGKRFDNGYLALDGIELSVRRGEILALVGGSGCGKSTLLRLLAGLERPSRGAIELDGTPITGPHPAIGIVFQEPRLMPWLTVAQNVGFGLARLGREERTRLVDTALARVGLSAFADALPRRLSGGMSQRVALARALVARPDVLLLDEPFSALDALTREDLQDHLLDVWAQENESERPTLVLVTHDIEEALVLGDRVVVMRGNPGGIFAEHDIALPRRARREHDGFQRLRRLLLDELKAAQRGGVPPDPVVSRAVATPRGRGEGIALALAGE